MTSSNQPDPLDVDAQRRSRAERKGYLADDQAADDAAAARPAAERSIDDHRRVIRQGHQPG